MEPMFEKLTGVMWLLLLCLGAVILWLGKALFFPAPEKPVEMLNTCGTEDLYPNTYSDGSSVFKANCARCHNINDAKLVGPGLGYVHDRVPQPAETWLRAFISNADSLYKTGNPYQKGLRKQYKKERALSPFNHHFSFTKQEWADLLAYLESP